MNEQINKSYYAVIPANVRYNKELNANAKLLYGEITALANDKGYCWANNSYFAQLYEVSKETISRWISKLEKLGYLSVSIIYKENTREIIERRLYITGTPQMISEKTYVQNDNNINTYRQNNQEAIEQNINSPIDNRQIINTPIDKNIKTYGRNNQEPIDENVKDNNTVNNTVNNKKEKENINNNINNNNNNKSKDTKTDFDKFINSYTQNEELKQTIYEFIKMRKTIKKPLTTKALDLLLKKLDKLSSDDELKIKILEQSIEHSWQTVYQYKGDEYGYYTGTGFRDKLERETTRDNANSKTEKKYSFEVPKFDFNPNYDYSNVI